MWCDESIPADEKVSFFARVSWIRRSAKSQPGKRVEQPVVWCLWKRVSLKQTASEAVFPDKVHACTVKKSKPVSSHIGLSRKRKNTYFGGGGTFKQFYFLVIVFVTKENEFCREGSSCLFFFFLCRSWTSSGSWAKKEKTTKLWTISVQFRVSTAAKYRAVCRPPVRPPRPPRPPPVRPEELFLSQAFFSVVTSLLSSYRTNGRTSCSGRTFGRRQFLITVAMPVQGFFRFLL